jgi:hypothetical protein
VSVKVNDAKLSFEELDQINGGTVIATHDAGKGYDMAIFTLSRGWGAMDEFSRDLAKCKELVSADKNWLGAMEKEVARATVLGNSSQAHYISGLLAATKNDLGIK